MGKHRRGLVGTLAVATALVVLAVFLAGAMTLWVLDVTKDFGKDLARSEERRVGERVCHRV